MDRKIKILLSLPRTIWFNLRYLPFKQALRLPLWVAHNTKIKHMGRGRIELLGEISPALIRIGYHEADGVDSYATHTIIDVYSGGKLIFKNDAHIGQGAVLCVKDNATLSLGHGFAISGTTSIICSKRISFGTDVQLSWNSLIMDGDAHKIFDTNGNWINPPEEIIIGNKVWIAANTTILKGTEISDNVIIAANSLVNKSFTDQNVIIGGQPARVLKYFGYFSI